MNNTRKIIAGASAFALVGLGVVVLAPAASATGYHHENPEQCYSFQDWTVYAQQDLREVTPYIPEGPATYTALYDWDETRATGHYEATEAGLHIWTEGATSTDKVALYRSVNVPLASVGGTPWVEYTATTGITPGSQVVVDITGDGLGDGILINEPVYGDAAWLSNSASADFKAGAPHVGGGYGSENYGTLTEWGEKFPTATVVGVGFSLGSGVLGDGVVHYVNVGGTEYWFTQWHAGTPAEPATYDWFNSDVPTQAFAEQPAESPTIRWVATDATESVKVWGDCPPFDEFVWTNSGWYVIDEGDCDTQVTTSERTISIAKIGQREDGTTFTIWSKVKKTETETAPWTEEQIEECEVDPTPTPEPTETVTPAPVTPETTKTALAATGGSQMPWFVPAGAALLILAGGLTFVALRKSN